MTFGEIFEKWWPEKKKLIRKSSASNYYLSWASIEPIIKDVSPETFGQSQAQALVNRLVERGLGAKSIHDRLALLKMMLIYIREDLQTQVPPMNWRLRLPTPQRRLIKNFDRAEAKRVLKYVRKEIIAGKPRRVSVALALMAGLRIGEVCGLRWEDFDFKRRTFVVQRTVNIFHDKEMGGTDMVVGPPKTSAGYREVPVHPILMKLLRLAYGKIEQLDGYVLTGTDDPAAPRATRESFDRFSERNNLTKINFHGLRHTFATILIEAGVDVKAVSDILGHANVATTYDLYVHPSAEAKRLGVMRAFRKFKIFEDETGEDNGMG